MKILFCPQIRACRELGGSKVVLELAEEMSQLGWKCKIVSIPEIAEIEKIRDPSITRRSLALHRYLQREAASYDIVEYDHVYSRFARNEIPPRTLFVARSVLLAHHFDAIQFPTWPNLKTWFSTRTERYFSSRSRPNILAHINYGIAQTDVINVSNQRDQEVLVRNGIPAGKIIVLPFGIRDSQRLAFNSVAAPASDVRRLVMVGSFDYRKGCVDIPRVWRGVRKNLGADVKLRLLGTIGMYQTENQVRSFFSRSEQSALEIHPTFMAEDLPSLLQDCSVGMFPSYLEGFGIGVVEMLAAGIPVIAYDSPGPGDILDSENLVPPGDTTNMAMKLTMVMTAKSRMQELRVEARRRSQCFSWKHIACETDRLYRIALSGKRAPRYLSVVCGVRRDAAISSSRARLADLSVQAAQPIVEKDQCIK